MNFESGSKVNKEKLTGQNKLVFDILESGKTINCYEAQEYYITALNSRISDLRNRHGVIIYDRYITTRGGSKVKEYSLNSF